jgi:hypothetical protein
MGEDRCLGIVENDCLGMDEANSLEIVEPNSEEKDVANYMGMGEAAE